MAMKIDFQMLEQMAAAGASAAVLLAVIRPMFEVIEAQKKRKRPKDAARSRQRYAARRGEKRNLASENERDAATLSDTPRARLFREGSGALVTLNLSEDRSRKLIVQWLKLTNDDDQLVLATILRARDLGAADAPGWILQTLKGKLHGRSGGSRGGKSGELFEHPALTGMARALSKQPGSRLSGSDQTGRRESTDAVADDQAELGTERSGASGDQETPDGTPKLAAAAEYR